MSDYKTPGVFVEEISNLPPSVAGVATAIPAFIGYTEIGPEEVTATEGTPVIKRITTLLEFITEFGTASPAHFRVDPAGAVERVTSGDIPSFSLYYAMSHYFQNGGGPCYVVSVGNYDAATPTLEAFQRGVSALEQEDEPTLIVLTDAAMLLQKLEYYAVCSQAMAQCDKLGDRFTILDVVESDEEGLRGAVSTHLKYGAAYTPYLETTISHSYLENQVTINTPDENLETAEDNWTYTHDGLVVSYAGSSDRRPTVRFVQGQDEAIGFEVVDDSSLTVRNILNKTRAQIVEAWDTNSSDSGFMIELQLDEGTAVDDGQTISYLSSTELAPGTEFSNSFTLNTIQETRTGLYNSIKSRLSNERVILPPSAAMAGIYARVDRERGVWKAPANVGVMSVIGPVEKITDEQQENLNIDVTAGKSINAIRAFTGKGTLVWGARTLAGNDNEWRYVPVRRLFITVEESVKKASAFAVFEPNVQLTWLKVKGMIESYLYGLWQKGALAGASSGDAYYVNVGLGTTMTPQDVLEGRMIVEIGIAAVRPAEFIILRFSHKLQTS